MSWSILLERPLRAAFRDRPTLVLLPNDAAFPYDRLGHMLRERAIGYLLVQEGIRFPIPGAGDRYGASGCTAIAAWGESSREFFERQGVSSDIIHITGNPRFDALLKAGTGEARRRGDETVSITPRTVLLLTNPIDDLGFCTSAEKLALVRAFFEHLAPLLADPAFRVVVKLHGRESYDAYRGMIATSALRERIHLLQNHPTHDLLARCRAAVVIASTVGLEALLHDCALGVLEIPGHGFVVDYVQSGAAVGLRLDSGLPDQVEALLAGSPALRAHAAAYTARNLAGQGRATANVVGLIRSLTANRTAASGTRFALHGTRSARPLRT